jgi:hypothetical protein
VRRQLRDFLLENEPLPSGAWVGNGELVAAVRTGLRVGRVFERHGLSAAVAALPPVPARRSARGRANRPAIFCARSAGWRLQGLLRTVSGAHRCLHESLALGAGLRSLGFQVQVVIGYPVIERPDGRDELHAWPALGDTPLVGRPDSSRTNYVELARYPAGNRWGADGCS